jgi:hypothetical protein
MKLSIVDSKEIHQIVNEKKKQEQIKQQQEYKKMLINLSKLNAKGSFISKN